MLDFKTTVSHTRRETTVAAIDSHYGYLASCTSAGTGSRVATYLKEEARRQAEQQLAYLNRAAATQAAAGSATETRLIGQRL